MKFKIMLLVCCGFQFLMAQSPYELNWKRESAYIGLGLATNISGFAIGSNNVIPLTETEILSLDRASVNAFDRGATFNFSTNAQRKSDLLQYTSYALPVLFLTNKKTRSDFGKIMALFSETLLITGGITNLAKKTTQRLRPFAYNELVPSLDKQTHSTKYSFFSGHTSTCAASSFFMAKVFSDYHPESRWKPLVWSLAVAAPATMGYLRVKGGKHYPTDVITGFAVGGAIGFLVPHLHKKKNNNRLSIFPTGNGALVSFRLE